MTMTMAMTKNKIQDWSLNLKDLKNFAGHNIFVKIMQPQM